MPPEVHSNHELKVLALASYPIQAAATRYRLHQFVEPLQKHGIELNIRSFFDSAGFASLYKRQALAPTAARLLKAAVLRFRDVFAARKADVILIQREAMIFGPPIIEWLSTRLGGSPLVLDLDDATYLHYLSPVYGRLGSALKWFSKTDDLIRWASVVTCGNRTIAEYAKSKGAETCLIPTVVDTEVFRPARRLSEGPPVLGWIGTHSTFPYLESILPALRELAKTHRFKLKLVGSGRVNLEIPGVEVENREWDLAREVEDFQSFDIGLYPIDTSLYDEQWARGKSGFKAIQYMAVGIPYVATPVGAINEIGEPGVTHFQAQTPDEWREVLGLLMSDSQMRERMGHAGRNLARESYSLPEQAARLAQVLYRAASKTGPAN
jgi:glycosyltransferase involved in cell wall biosynthesis